MSEIVGSIIFYKSWFFSFYIYYITLNLFKIALGLVLSFDYEGSTKYIKLIQILFYFFILAKNALVTHAIVLW